MAEIVARSAPSITSLGLIMTKAKLNGNPQQVEQALVAIVGEWRHYIYGDLTDILKEFGSTRASALMDLSWTGDFTLIHDMFDFIGELLPSKTRERKRDWWRQWRKKAGLSKT